MGVVVNGLLLRRACRKYNYAIPDDGIVIFGIRGSLPVSKASFEFKNAHDINFFVTDYVCMRCVIGQYLPKDDKLALFPGSTVPSLSAIRGARLKGGVGVNQLLPGRYAYVKGVHKQGRPSGHRAFRQASFMPVQRTRDDLSYGPGDGIDVGTGPGAFIWDNLHSAYSEAIDAGYSSAGCQVVCGMPSSAARGGASETGPWRYFVENAYGQFPKQDRFTYILFESAALAAIAQSDDTQVVQSLRYGSSGDLVRDMQKALIAAGFDKLTVDGDFGRNTLVALLQFQTERFGPLAADGECGPETARAFGLVLPVLAGAHPVTARAEAIVVPDHQREIDDDTDLTDEERGRLTQWARAPFDHILNRAADLLLDEDDERRGSLLDILTESNEIEAVDNVAGTAPKILSTGIVGDSVRDLQHRLKELGYPLGDVDGTFGPFTQMAVFTFQRANNLPGTGVADARTLEALIGGKGPPIAPARRDVSEVALLEKGSQVILLARQGRWLAAATVLLGVFGFGDALTGLTTKAADAAKEAAALEATSTAADVVSTLPSILGVQGGVWPALAVLGVLGWRRFNGAALKHVKDHADGRNLRN